MSVKFQVTMPEPLMAELKHTAEKMGLSAAELIRQTMIDKLRTRREGSKSDPFGSITGLVDSEQSDLASQVDEILYR
jgi:metal-responsive CopG/Arc/MetJ family transcriptional regulator